MAEVPKVKLNNGKEMPILGLGTWQSEPNQVYEAVKHAIDAGYRHIDCAMVYGNEAEIGKALKEVIAEGKIKREDLFITSKLWSTYHRKERVLVACKKTLQDLGLDYLDLYLVHWPITLKEGDEMFPKNEKDEFLYETADKCDTWKGMEECYEAGLVKSIGLSNFNSEQMKKIFDSCKVKPTVNQVECHPYLNQNKLIEFCKNYKVAVTAYSPLGSPSRPWTDPEEPTLLNDPKIKQIADNHKKTVAQVLIRFQIERGIIVIPKSVTKERIKSNFEVFDFELTKEELDLLSNYDVKYRYCSVDKWWGDSPDYPFNIEF